MNYRDHLADPHRACSIVAHRGVWQAAPENSLPAIEAAIAAGHDMVEIDIRQSADGQFILLHDDSLERMTGLDWAPEHMAAAELAALRLRNRDGGAGNGVTDAGIPLLREVFDLTRDRILIHLDIKDRSLIPAVIACAQEMGVDQQVDFWADIKSEADLAWVEQTIVPHGVPFIARTRLEQESGARQFELAMRLKPLICELSFSALDQVSALRDELSEAGTVMWVNTLDGVASPGFTDTAALEDPEAVWGRLLDAGFTCIQTDEMAALRQFLAERI